MDLGFRLDLTHCLEMCLCDEDSGIGESVFPKVEEWLTESSDHWQALQFVASKKDMQRYRCIIDFLFCEIFVDYRGGCFRFYDECGPQLRFIISTEQIANFQRRLMAAMRLAHDMFQERRRASWTSFRCEALRLAA
jgi:hypothetical protein